MKSMFVVSVLMACSVCAQSPQERIESYFSGGDKSVKMKTHTEVYKITPQGDLTLRIYEPVLSKERRSCVVFFYGGGWKGGSITQFIKQSEFMVSHGYVAITPQYRTEKGHGTTPRESVMDAKSCIRWVRSHAMDLGIDPNRLVVGGGSAGGHLAAACASVTKINDLSDDLSVSCVPDCLVLFNPVVNNGPGEDSYGYDRVKDYWQEFSPLHNIDDKKMPPTAIFLGTKDQLIPITVGEEFVSKVRKTGAAAKLFLYKDQQHGFFNYREEGNPFFYQALQDMADFLKETGFLQQSP